MTGLPLYVYPKHQKHETACSEIEYNISPQSAGVPDIWMRAYSAWTFTSKLAFLCEEREPEREREREKNYRFQITEQECEHTPECV